MVKVAPAPPEEVATREPLSEEVKMVRQQSMLIEKAVTKEDKKVDRAKDGRLKRSVGCTFTVRERS